MNCQELRKLFRSAKFKSLFRQLNKLELSNEPELQAQRDTLSANYTRYERERSLMDSRDYERAMNQLKRDLNNLISEICKLETPQAEEQEEQEEKKPPSEPLTRLNKEVKTGKEGTEVSKGVSKTTDSLPPNDRIPQWLLFAFGALALIASLWLAFSFDCLNKTQYTFLRILIAIAAGFLGGFMLGVVQVQYGDAIKASGGLALLVLFYLWNPAGGIVPYGDCTEEVLLKGTVYLDGKPTSNIQFRIQQAEKSVTTNRDGIYKMTISAKYLQKKRLDLYFTKPDTLIHLDPSTVSDWEDLNFEINRKIEPDEEDEQTEEREKPKVKLHEITLNNAELAKSVVWKGITYPVPKNGVLQLPGITAEGEKLKIIFKDETKDPWGQTIHQGITEIDLF